MERLAEVEEADQEEMQPIQDLNLRVHTDF
jgi:hypothetical protein